jgi:hypothetical protein
LKLQYAEPLSTFASNFNMRCYTTGLPGGAVLLLRGKPAEVTG